MHWAHVQIDKRAIQQPVRQLPCPHEVHSQRTSGQRPRSRRASVSGRSSMTRRPPGVEAVKITSSAGTASWVDCSHKKESSCICQPGVSVSQPERVVSNSQRFEVLKLTHRGVDEQLPDRGLGQQICRLAAGVLGDDLQQGIGGAKGCIIISSLQLNIPVCDG